MNQHGSFFSYKIYFILILQLSFCINTKGQSLSDFADEYAEFNRSYENLIRDKLEIPIDSLNNFIINPSKRIRDDKKARYLTLFKKRIEAFEAYINEIEPNNNVLKNYLLAKLLPIQQKTRLLLLKTKPPLWQEISEDERPKITKSDFEYVINIVSKQRDIINKYLVQEEFANDLQKIKTSKLRKINFLSEDQIESAYNQIENLQETINLFNTFLYKELTPNLTIKQLEIYLSNAPKETSDTFYTSAFEKLFKAYTQTGEPVTIKEFSRIVNQYDLDLLFNNESFRELKKEYEDLADAKSRILNNDDIGSLEEYESIFQMPPNDLDIIAIQKIFKYHKKKSKIDLIQILKKYQSSFEGNNEYFDFYNQLQQNENFTYTLDSIKICHETPIDGEFFIDENKFVFSNSGELLNKGITKIYDNKDWTLIKEKKIPKDKENDQYFFFTEGEFIDHDLTSDVQEGGKMKDISVHKNGNMMLFISTNNQSRHKYEYIYDTETDIERRKRNKKNSNYYINSFRNNSSSILRDPTSGDGAFRGREKSYENTEIYYSFKNRNNTWGAPKLLTKINTPYSERAPTFSHDGSYIYFASDGYMGLGGFDIYKVKIKIDKSNKTIEAIEKPINFHNINSTEDELFFKENETQQFLSTNRSGQWCVYNVRKTRLSDENNANNNLQNNNSPTPNKNTTSHTQISTPDMTVTIDCNYSTIFEGDALISGYILDEYKNLINPATIEFININDPLGSLPVKAKIDGRYTASVERGKKYRVIATGSKNGVPLKYISDEFIDVCMSQTISYNPIMSDLEKKGFFKFKAPFFFAFRKKNVPEINNFSIMRERHYNLIFGVENIPPSYSFILTGYADILGDYSENLELGLSRANETRDFLLSQFSNLEKSFFLVKTVGATNKFNNDPFYKKYLEYMIPKDESIYPDKNNRQKNRRVELIIVDNTVYKSFNEKHCEPSCIDETLPNKSSSYKTKCRAGITLNFSCKESEKKDQVIVKVKISNIELKKEQSFSINFFNHQNGGEIGYIDDLTKYEFLIDLPTSVISHPIDVKVKIYNSDNKLSSSPDCTITDKICPNFK